MSTYFRNLNYSLGDEDTSLELSVLPEGARHAVAVAGSGGRVLPLLAKQPARLTCVDISAPQLAFTRLRLELLRHLDLPDYLAFLGYRKSMSPMERQTCFADLELPAADRQLLSSMFTGAQWHAPIYLGRFERMLGQLARINRLFTGKAGQGIFLHDDLERQRDYYRSDFPVRRWKTIIGLLGNSTALNSLLYRGEFPRNNLGISSYRVYERIFHSLFTSLPARSSFFLQLVFFGELRYDEGLPIECQPAVFNAAKLALQTCEVKMVQGDVLSCVRERPGVDFVSLSDVPSFLQDVTAQSVLQTMRPALAPGAITVIRGHMRVVAPDTTGFDDITADYSNAIANESTGLWKTAVYCRQSTGSGAL